MAGSGGNVCYINRNSLYSAVPLQRGKFSWKFSLKTTHSAPASESYGLSFVGPHSDLYSASATAVMYTISYYIGPRYNDTQLYI